MKVSLLGTPLFCWETSTLRWAMTEGNDREIWRGVCGRNGPPNLSDVRLMDFCASCSLSISNTMFSASPGGQKPIYGRSSVRPQNNTPSLKILPNSPETQERKEEPCPHGLQCKVGAADHNSVQSQAVEGIFQRCPQSHQHAFRGGNRIREL